MISTEHGNRVVFSKYFPELFRCYFKMMARFRSLIVMGITFGIIGCIYLPLVSCGRYHNYPSTQQKTGQLPPGETPNDNNQPGEGETDPDPETPPHQPVQIRTPMTLMPGA